MRFCRGCTQMTVEDWDGVRASPSDGSTTPPVVGGLKYLGEAKFLEQQIEERLKIVPRPVVGECNE